MGSRGVPALRPHRSRPRGGVCPQEHVRQEQGRVAATDSGETVATGAFLSVSLLLEAVVTEDTLSVGDRVAAELAGAALSGEGGLRNASRRPYRRSNGCMQRRTLDPGGGLARNRGRVAPVGTLCQRVRGATPSCLQIPSHHESGESSTRTAASIPVIDLRGDYGVAVLPDYRDVGERTLAQAASWCRHGGVPSRNLTWPT